VRPLLRGHALQRGEITIGERFEYLCDGLALLQVHGPVDRSGIVGRVVSTKKRKVFASPAHGTADGPLATQDP
jgi:hypothetical protein